MRSVHHEDSALGAGRDVDVVRAAAGLAEKLQVRKSFDQLARIARALAHGNDGFRVTQVGEQPLGRGRDVAEDAHIVTGEPREAVEPGDALVVVVGNGDDHSRSLAEARDGAEVLAASRNRSLSRRGRCPQGHYAARALRARLQTDSSMTSAPQAPGGRRIRVRSIRYALLARFVALIVFAFAVFCAGLYVLIVKPTREEIATAELLRATAQVESEFKSLVAQAERVLRTASEWGKGGHFDLFDVSTFNRLFMPLLATRPLVSSVFIADGTGRMLMLDTKSEGEWRNRVGDIARRGKLRCTLRWRDATTFLGEECAEGDYDPRQRPWHIGAMSLARDSDVYWTDPYVFFASQQPGITASMKWRGAADDQPNVVAFDIKLLNLSRFITTLSVGRNGRLALLTNDGKIVGATAPSSNSDADIKRMVLKPPDKSGFPRCGSRSREVGGGGAPV